LLRCSNVSIRTRIALAFIIVSLTFVGVTYALHVLVDSMASSLEVIAERDTATMAVSDRIQTSLLTQARALRSYARSGDVRHLDVLRREELRAPALIEDAARVTGDGEPKALVADLRARLLVHHVRERRRLSALASAGHEEAALASAERMELHVDRALALAQRLMSLARERSLSHGAQGGLTADRAHDVAVAATPAIAALAFVLSSLLALSILRPLNRMLKGVEAVRRGDLSVRTGLDRRDELGQFSAALDSTLDRLAFEREELENANGHLEREHRRAEDELELARLVQLRLLPEPTLRAKEYELAALLRPAGFVGGDFYHFLPRPWGVRVFVGDVAGKGVPAALTMASSLALVSQPRMEDAGPRQLLRKLNDSLIGNIELGPTPFVTAVVVEWEPATGTLRYSTAGHPLPVLCRDGRAESLPGNPAMPLGLYENVEFGQEQAVLAPGERLAVFTDGLTDLKTPKGERLGLEPLLAALLSSPGLRGPALVEAVADSLEAGSTGRQDDETLVVLEAL